MSTFYTYIGTEMHGQDQSKRDMLVDRFKVGVVSSITLESRLLDNIAKGAQLSRTEIAYSAPTDPSAYDGTKIKADKNNKKSKCDVIISVGGNFAFKAISKDDDIPLISLVGVIPADEDVFTNTIGGVSLQSSTFNKNRKAYIAKKVSGTIVLYTNRNSQMHKREASDWDDYATLCVSSGCNAGNNDPGDPSATATGFFADFAPAGDFAAQKEDAGGVLSAPPTNVKGVIISDDPFFRAYRNKLVQAANSWIGSATDRFVVYPSQMYGTKILPGDQLPKSGRSALLGPDLESAFRLLGLLARTSSDQQSRDFLGWFSVPYIETTIT